MKEFFKNIWEKIKESTLTFWNNVKPILITALTFGLNYVSSWLLNLIKDIVGYKEQKKPKNRVLMNDENKTNSYKEYRIKAKYNRKIRKK